MPDMLSPESGFFSTRPLVESSLAVVASLAEGSRLVVAR